MIHTPYRGLTISVDQEKDGSREWAVRNAEASEPLASGSSSEGPVRGSFKAAFRAAQAAVDALLREGGG